MNDDILRLLHVRGDFLSGEEISRQLGISRTAVWKRIGKLKEEGYEIDSVPHKGYRLDPFPRGRIYGWVLEQAFEELDSQIFDRLIFAETLDSTNLEIKRRIAEGELRSGMVAVCEQQTAGRGRRGRAWASPAGSGLWFSLGLNPDIQPAHAPMLTIIAGMAVRDALEALYGLEAGIKWPNDIIVGNRKICGILTEMTMEDLEMSGVVVGIGINVRPGAFPEELKDIATSIQAETSGEAPDRARLLCQVLSRFEHYYKIFIQTEDLSALHTTYEAHCVNIGRTVRVISPMQEFEAKALGIDDMGGLRLQLEDGTLRTVTSGEVTIRGVMGYGK